MSVHSKAGGANGSRASDEDGRTSVKVGECNLGSILLFAAASRVACRSRETPYAAFSFLVFRRLPITVARG